MRVYINAGFGEPIGGESLRLFAALGFDGVRQDVPSGRIRELVQEFAHAPLTPLFLVGGGKMTDPPEVTATVSWAVAACMQECEVRGAIEIGNEPDLTGIPPESFAKLVTECARGIWAIEPAMPVIMGGIMSTNERGLKYLERALEAGVPPGVRVGYHTYRAGHPDQPNPGFHNRAAEFHRLANLANGRPLWNTEIGWHTVPVRVPRAFPMCWLSRTVRHSDEDVFKFLVRERELNKQAGAEVMTVYQANDGPNPNNPGDRFGIRYLDGKLKPSSGIVGA